MKPFQRRRVLGATALGLAFLAAPGLQAQTAQTAPAFPAKAVRVVLPFSAGSGPDAVVRHVGEKVSRAWGQQFTVDNKPGANGWLSVGEVKRTAPDGYNLLLVDVATVALQPHLYKQMPFDPVKDFEPVAPLYTANFFVVVGANSPYKTFADLVAAAKATPNQVTYGSWGIGSVAHVGSAMVENTTATQMRHIPFKEIPQLYTAVAAGEVDWAFGSAATVGGLYRAKKVRLLAYAGPRRLAGFTDVPTVSETAGMGSFELKSWVALYGPRGMPKAVVDRIHASVVAAQGEADVKERFATVGFEGWSALPADIARTAEADSARFAETVKRARISVE
ncbi:Bug family tripartite tricarboxylate transporter substrate binding protein [Ramlibacter sp. MAHUQ-53]|uniref:Bug family tripartite tricarboxylate transporter substrate binding protein n=1 Tax=unclassified Ramlibacter TaxID=2617605 RepID=UPI0036400158